MNAFTMARTAYATANTAVRTDRSTEYQIIGQVTARLREAILNKSKDYPGFVAALDENRKLWEVFGTEVADAGNGLPKDLRARLFYLAEFTNAHTAKVLRSDEDPRVLLEVNIAVMKGLRAGSETK